MYELQTYRGVAKGWTPVARRYSAIRAERLQRLLCQVRPNYMHRIQRIAPARPTHPLCGFSRQDWWEMGRSLAVLGAVYGILIGASFAVSAIVPVPGASQQHVLTVKD